MLRRIAITLAATSLIGAASIPVDALAAEHGHGSGFAARGVGVAAAPHTFAGRGLVGRGFEPGFRRHRFARFGAPLIGLGLGLGAYSYYNDACYAWTPYGYMWVCGYDY